jgi:hypothetical protein
MPNPVSEPSTSKRTPQLPSAHIDQDDVLDSLISDALHSDIAATARLQNKYCREMLMLPTCGAEAITAFPSFATQLRMALAQDYNMPNIFQFGSKYFQWCKHVSFSSG